MATTSRRVQRRSVSIEHNLRVPLSSLVGRGRDLEGISKALRNSRLVTLVGPGGVGKTRLALEVARRELARRAGEVWLVDFAAVSQVHDVAGETARVLGIGASAATTPTDALRAYLTARDVLLVLDNCEHVIDACAALAAALLSASISLRIVATSREMLAIGGETVWRVEPLEASDAHRLFIDRARKRWPEFLEGEDDQAVIERLCARLDRLPLAIEIAAARLGVMSPSEILSGLNAQLGGGDRLAPPHHRTLRTVVEWSYQLLDAPEKEAFRTLAVFVGTFDADAARAVAPTLTLDLLARLVDKSLIAVTQSPRGETRYRLLETVRQYASERLVEAGELDAAQARHLSHFSTLVDTSRDGWPSSGALRFVTKLHDDYENVRTALKLAAARDPCAALDLLAGMKDLFLLLGQGDGRRLAQVLLERCPRHDRTWAEVEISAGILAMLAGDGEAAMSVLTEASKLTAEIGERTLEGWACFGLGLTQTLAGAIEPGRAHLERGRALHRELGVRTGEARATAALGLSYVIENEQVRGRELVEEALSLNDTVDDDWGRGQCHLYLGIITASSGADPSRASLHLRQAVELLRPFHGGPLLPVALVEQAGVLARRDPAKALLVAAAAWSMRARAGGEFAPFYRARAWRVRTALESAMAAEAPRLWAEGARLTIDDAVALAFTARRPRPNLAAGLSAREVEVARLVADGLFNKAIATRLHLSVRTVESHVRHALAKAGLENRTQLATWARERIQ